MPKYKRKPEIVTAETFKEGMEDAWCLLYSGNMHSYEKVFSKHNGKQRAQDFVANNEGFKEVSDEDQLYEIIYETPYPYIRGKNGKQYILHDTDVVVTTSKGNRIVYRKEQFEELYELIEE